jgi:hypothetical protein
MPSLQFDRAEFTTSPASSVTCASCNQNVIQSYYEAGGKTICSTCRESLSSAEGSGGVARFLRALIVGFGAAIIGSIVWWGVRKLTGYEIGLISIGIGIGVGRAVRWGGRNRGGWKYQLLAVLLTYASIAGNYMPDVVTQIRNDVEASNVGTKSVKNAPGAPAAAGKTTPVKASASESIGFVEFILGVGAIFLMAAAAPFFGGAGSIISLLIIGFGLWEAWKTNRRVELVINGPYSIAPAASV